MNKEGRTSIKNEEQRDDESEEKHFGTCIIVNVSNYENDKNFTENIENCTLMEVMLMHAKSKYN